MFRIFFLLLTVLVIGYACSCNSKSEDNIVCNYTLNDLLLSDTPKVKIVKKNDTMTEVRDVTTDSSFGRYVFDENARLRFYSFQINNKMYEYSESYGKSGELVEIEGAPIVECRVWKKSNDTILFSMYLFSLFKEYQEIEVVTNENDTILPKYLYKGNFYSNTKCFEFKLKSKAANNLILYTTLIGSDTCRKQKFSLKDTISLQKFL